MKSVQASTYSEITALSNHFIGTGLSGPLQRGGETHLALEGTKAGLPEGT